jgi:hypothetical protein
MRATDAIGVSKSSEGDILSGGLAAYSFGLESLSMAERSAAELVLTKGRGEDAAQRSEALFAEFGHGLYEYFPGAAPPGFSGVREPLEWYRSLHTQNEWSAILSLAAGIPPLERTCELSVCIPVAAAEEPLALVRNTVSQYARQSISAERFEVVLFLNWPLDLDADRTARLDALRAGVSSLQEEFADLRLRVFGSAVPKEALRIGFLRKLVHDVVLERELLRGDVTRALLHFRGDADLRELPPHFLEDRIRLHGKFSRSPCLRGEVDYCLNELEQDPAVLAGVRLDQGASRWLSAQIPQLIWGGGPNVSFSSVRYSAISGYSRFDRRAEDSSFDFRAAGLPEYNVAPRAMRLGARQRIKVSARRLLVGAARGVAPACLWVTEGDHAFERVDSTVRHNMSSPGGSSRWEGIDEASFEKRLTTFVSDTISYRFARHPELVPRVCNEVLPRFGVRAVPLLGAVLDAIEKRVSQGRMSSQEKARSADPAMGGAAESSRTFPPLLEVKDIGGLKDWLLWSRASKERRQ